MKPLDSNVKSTSTVKLSIPIKNQWSYNHIPRNKDLKLHIDNRCNAPSNTLLVDHKGECFVCSCEAWLPITVGQVTDFRTIKEVWSTPVAKKLQADIDLGSFDHCAVTRCGVIENTDMVKSEYTISINIDESCNLQCPSCRPEKIMLTHGSEYDQKLSAVNHLVDMLENFDQPCRIIMSGNGDPLASSIMRPLLHRFRPKPAQWIKLFTNGLLLKKQLENNPIMQHIDEYLISIDAGSKAVYEKVRLGGNWNILLENLDFLKTNIKKNVQVTLAYVLQKDNYADMENFCRVALDRGFMASITRLENWGTWDTFAAHDVLDATHAEHQAAVDMLQGCYDKYQSKFGKQIFYSAGLLPYVKL